MSRGLDVASAWQVCTFWVSSRRVGPHDESNSDLTLLIPLLINLLGPIPSFSAEPQFEDTKFIPASDALQELMTKSALSNGSGTKSLTEPLLLWLARWAGNIVDETLKCMRASLNLRDLSEL
jgi:hypothetical protein